MCLAWRNLERTGGQNVSSSLHPTKPERTNSVGVWEVEYLLRIRHLILCPLSYLIDVALDDNLWTTLSDCARIGILLCFLACMPSFLHGHIYYDECVIHTVWAGCFGILAMNIYTKIWFNEVSCSREILFSILEFSCWLLQAWLSCHVLIFVFTFAFSMNAIADSVDQLI